MIHIAHFSNETLERQFIPIVDKAYTDASKILDKLPGSIDIKFTDNGGSELTGVGGFSLSPKQINLAIHQDFEDRAAQEVNLRSTVFHEAFHVQQGFTYTQSPFTALQSAIYEGCAIKFERDYAKNTAVYGDYSSCTEDQLNTWLDEIRTVGTEYFENEDTWRKWAFYHAEYKQKWIVYRVGSWLVDRILADNKLGILDLKSKTADEIIQLI